MGKPVRRVAVIGLPIDETVDAAQRAKALRRQLVADYCKSVGHRLLGRSVGDRPFESAPPMPVFPPGLPPRQKQTLQRLLAGDSEKQIALRLEVSPHTVHVYVKQLYRRFEVNSRGELLSRFVAGGESPE